MTKKTEEKKFLGVPYNFQVPTLSRIKNRCWNPDDKRIFTPKVFGWGWTVNFYRVFKVLGLVK